MKNVTVIGSRSFLRNAKVSWVTFIFLAVVFFVAKHDLFISLGVSFNQPAEFLEQAIAEGSLERRVAFFVLGIWGAVSLMRQGRYRLRINGFLGWLILFYLVWAFSSLIWAEDVALTFRRLVILAMLCLAALAISNSYTLREINHFVFLTTGCYLLIGLFVEIALGTFHPLVHNYRFAGTLHPNHQGLNCSLFILSGVTAALPAKRLRKIFLSCVLIGFFFLVLTKSRTSFVSVTLALFVYWALISSIRCKLASILIVSYFFCLLFLLFGDEFLSAIRKGILLGREDSSTYSLTGRIQIWKQSFEYIAKNPFIGYGYNSFWTPRNVYEEVMGVAESHSAYIDLILSVGYIGMINFVLILIFGIKKSVKDLKVYSNIAYAFLCSLLVFITFVGLLESAIIDPTVYLTFLSMVVLARLGFINRINLCGRRQKTTGLPVDE